MLVDDEPSGFRFLSDHDTTAPVATTTAVAATTVTPTSTPAASDPVSSVAATPAADPAPTRLTETKKDGTTSQTITSSEKYCKTGSSNNKCDLNGVYYDKRQINTYVNGWTEEFYDGEMYCQSALLIPGMSLISRPVLCVFYLLWLFYLFLGIDVIAGIFMEAIEVITSKSKVVEVMDKDGKTYSYDQPVWNATMANLSLMALGSSAPEILLSVLETVGSLGEPAGELGPSTIVGSAAFNLLVISGASIMAVSEEVVTTEKDS